MIGLSGLTLEDTLHLAHRYAGIDQGLLQPNDPLIAIDQEQRWLRIALANTLDTVLRGEIAVVV